jgi:hypothetical protein
MRHHALRAALGGVILSFASILAADVFELVDGDRISGKSLSEGSKTVRIQTPYGRLSVPRDKIARVVRADGKEEDWGRPGLVAASPSPAAPAASPLKLSVVITGKSFWWAWSKKAIEEQNFGLRFQLRLDDQPVATYLDAVAHEGEIRGAVVNTFSFAPNELKLIPGAGAQLSPPETQPGRIELKIALPRTSAALRRLRLAYQVNEGSAAAPAWRDAAAASLDVEQRPDAPLTIQLRQDAGTMDFAGKNRMKNVETFRLDASAERESGAVSAVSPPGR